MVLLYCGLSALPAYPGTEIRTFQEAVSALRTTPFDIVIWNWTLGELPQALRPRDSGLVLVTSDETLEFYRYVLALGHHRIVLSEEPGLLAEAIDAEWEQLLEARRNESYHSLFLQYGEHLKMHLWYDLIVEGRYENLLEEKPYRLLLFHGSEIRNSQAQQMPHRRSDSPSIISEVFPEAIAILALQHPWECVALPGDVRRFAERSAQCQAALEEKLGARRKIWQSPPILPREVHSFYQQVLSDALKTTEQSVSDLVCSYIGSHLGEKLTRKTISENLFFSPDYLAKVFREETGITMGAYLCGARLSRAKELLVQTRLPIGIIAAELGYQNFSEFSQWFKKLTGIVPSQYRKLHT